MEQRKFYQPDILSYLAEVMKQNTRAYAADFDYDAKRLWDSAQETDMEHRSFLWMSRPCGTWCVLEREVFLDDTNANCIWTHYADCPEGILAYRIVVEGIRDGKLAGKVIPIDYAKQVRRVMQSALPIVKIQYRDKNGSFCENSYHAFMNSTLPSQTSRCPPTMTLSSSTQSVSTRPLRGRWAAKSLKSPRTASTTSIRSIYKTGTRTVKIPLR